MQRYDRDLRYVLTFSRCCNIYLKNSDADNNISIASFIDIQITPSKMCVVIIPR